MMTLHKMSWRDLCPSPFQYTTSRMQVRESFWEHKLKELLSCLSQWLSQFPKRAKKGKVGFSHATVHLFLFTVKRKNKRRTTPHIHTKNREEERVPDMFKWKNNEFLSFNNEKSFWNPRSIICPFSHFNPSYPYCNILQGKLRNWTQDPAIN